jgi:hypothetical protein
MPEPSPEVVARLDPVIERLVVGEGLSVEGATRLVYDLLPVMAGYCSALLPEVGQATIRTSDGYERVAFVEKRHPWDTSTVFLLRPAEAPKGTE